jgi:uncharacterized caspase-like protein
LTEEFLEDLGGKRCFVVTACDVDEVSVESRELGHGLFTYYLTEGLKGAADYNMDGLVTVQELSEYVHDNVPRRARRLGGRMHPIMKGSLQGNPIISRWGGRPVTDLSY